MTHHPKPESRPLAQAPGRMVSVPEWATRLARLLDGAFVIPGTRIRVGLDPLLGLMLPELGDALTAVLSMTLLGVAWKQRVPKLVLGRMLVNLLIDALLGAVPLAGDLFDFAFRANEKNLALIERHRGDPSRKPTWGDTLAVAAAILAAALVVVVPILLGVALFRWLWRLLG